LEKDNKPEKIKDDVVVTLNYELRVNGEIVDSSEDGDPIVFLQGSNQVVSGLEKAIYGMKIGETRDITVSPDEGYGEYDPDAVTEVERSEFPDDFPLEPGIEITVHTEESDDEGGEFEEVMEATVLEVGKSVVKLDFNHPLAGKTLDFKVEVVDLREATEEEIEHGHVHGDDDEFEFDDGDLDELEY